MREQNVRLAKRLRQAREEAGLLQQEVALRLRRPQAYVSRCETGDKQIGAVELFEFARLYNKPLEWFFEPETGGAIATPPFLRRNHFNPARINHAVALPYGLSAEHVIAALDAVYAFFHRLNVFLIHNDSERFEDMVLGNSFAGMLSELVVGNVAKHSSGLLLANERVGGFPDLLPRGAYETASVLRGDEGIEVKSTKTTWQGHNVETGWFLLIRYQTDTKTQPRERRSPLEFTEVLCGFLTDEDWSLQERAETSRRTRTTSILATAIKRLRDSQAVYRLLLRP